MRTSKLLAFPLFEVFFFFFLKTLFEGLIIKNGLQILVSRSQSHKLLVYPSFFYKKYSHFVK